MKDFLLKIWLPRLALYLADNNKSIINLITAAISSAESRFPSTESNSHRGHRLAWVKDRAIVYLSGANQWKVNVIIEMLVAFIRIKNAKP